MPDDSCKALHTTASAYLPALFTANTTFSVCVCIYQPTNQAFTFTTQDTNYSPPHIYISTYIHACLPCTLYRPVVVYYLIIVAIGHLPYLVCSSSAIFLS